MNKDSRMPPFLPFMVFLLTLSGVYFPRFPPVLRCLFLSHPGEQPLKPTHGSRGFILDILDIRQKEPTLRQLFIVSHAWVAINGFVRKFLCFPGGSQLKPCIST